MFKNTHSNTNNQAILGMAIMVASVAEALFGMA